MPIPFCLKRQFHVKLLLPNTDKICMRTTLNDNSMKVLRSLGMFIAVFAIVLTAGVGAQEEKEGTVQDRTVSEKPVLTSLDRGPQGFDQRILVQDFIAKKDKIENLLHKQQMYEKLLTDVQKRTDELERVIENEKKEILLKKLNEINEQIKLINQNTQEP